MHNNIDCPEVFNQVRTLTVWLASFAPRSFYLLSANINVGLKYHFHVLEIMYLIFLILTLVTLDLYEIIYTLLFFTFVRFRFVL